MKVTFQQIVTGSVTDFSGVFKMENRMTYHFLQGHDFFEGCRAILVDKDRNPKWNPAKLSEVSPDTVNKYFEPIPGFPDLILN